MADRARDDNTWVWERDTLTGDTVDQPRVRRRSPLGWTPLALALIGAPLLSETHPEVEPPQSEGVVYVVAIGELPSAELERAGRALEDATRRLVVRLPARSLPPRAERRGGAYDAGALLDALLLDVPADTFRILGVTAAPLTATDHDTLIGFARSGERAMVYSTDALPSHDTEAARRGRVRRIVAHELGHTFGAQHCHQSCVMTDTFAAHSLDLHPEAYCPEHRAQVQRGLARGLSHPKALMSLASERLRLGRTGEAADLYRQVLRLRPGEPRALIALGIARMAGGELTAAEEAFVEATRAEPLAPQAYYGRAVIYGAGHAPHRAATFIEAAVARDTNPLRAHRAAGILYQDLLQDAERAVKHFETHIRYGGRDAQVVSRLTYLLSPTTITFSHPELVLSRYTDDEGYVLTERSARRSPRGHAGGSGLTARSAPEAAQRPAPPEAAR